MFFFLILKEEMLVRENGVSEFILSSFELFGFMRFEDSFFGKCFNGGRFVVGGVDEFVE